MCGYASAQSSVIYIILNRFTVNLTLIESIIRFLLHKYPKCTGLSGYVWTQNFMCLPISVSRAWLLDFKEWHFDFSTKGKSDPQFSML